MTEEELMVEAIKLDDEFTKQVVRAKKEYDQKFKDLWARFRKERTP